MGRRNSEVNRELVSYMDNYIALVSVLLSAEGFSRMLDGPVDEKMCHT